MSSGLLPDGFVVTGQLIAPSGTRTLFNQASVPLGWTQDTSAAFNDCDVRLNNSASGSGGANGWSTFNTGTSNNFNAYTLTTNNMPQHGHTVNDPGHTMNLGTARFTTTGATKASSSFNGISMSAVTGTNAVDPGLSTVAQGSGTPFTASLITPTIQYTSCILGVKA